ncbi:hypothetical protein ACFYNO_30865 [Kitasatospora sp. NPDC006697]|uniref:hypothetical protein n=1 Tax=Kitasatospora sp. NPDC006697 TaxID=3364020 RepID=UPI0036C858AA
MPDTPTRPRLADVAAAAAVDALPSGLAGGEPGTVVIPTVPRIVTRGSAGAPPAAAQRNET